MKDITILLYAYGVHILIMIFIGMVSLFLWRQAIKKDKKEKYERRDY